MSNQAQPENLDPNEAEAGMNAEAVNLSQTSVEKVQAELVRMNNSSAKQVSADQVKCVDQGAGQWMPSK
jgi:hypothetical protein